MTLPKLTGRFKLFQKIINPLYTLPLSFENSVESIIVNRIRM